MSNEVHDSVGLPDSYAAAYRRLIRRRTLFILLIGVAAVVSLRVNQGLFHSPVRDVMAVSLLLAFAPVLIVMVIDRIWLGSTDSPADWQSGTASWDAPIKQGNIGAFSRAHLVSKDATISGVVWRRRQRPWTETKDVYYFADDKRIVLTAQDSPHFYTLKRS